MPGAGFVIPGTGPGTGPIVATPLYSFGTGLDDYVRRLHGSRLPAVASGTPVDTWTDVGSDPDTFTAGTLPAGGSITVQVSGTERWLKLLSGTSSISTQGTTLNGAKTTLLGTDCTVMLIMRQTEHTTSSAGGQIFTAAGYQVQRAGDGRLQVNGNPPTAPNTASTLATFDGTLWHAVFFTTPATVPLVQVDAATTTSGSTVGRGTTAGTVLKKLANLAGTPESVEYAEVVIWNRILTTGQIATVRQAARDAWILLP